MSCSTIKPHRSTNRRFATRPTATDAEWSESLSLSVYLFAGHNGVPYKMAEPIDVIHKTGDTLHITTLPEEFKQWTIY